MKSASRRDQERKGESPSVGSSSARRLKRPSRITRERIVTGPCGGLSIAAVSGRKS